MTEGDKAKVEHKGATDDGSKSFTGKGVHVPTGDFRYSKDLPLNYPSRQAGNIDEYAKIGSKLSLAQSGYAGSGDSSDIDTGIWGKALDKFGHSTIDPGGVDTTAAFTGMQRIDLDSLNPNSKWIDGKEGPDNLAKKMLSTKFKDLMGEE